MWLDAGVRLALAAHIATQEIVSYGEDGSVQRFGTDSALSCEPVLPGFTCPVGDFFNYR